MTLLVPTLAQCLQIALLAPLFTACATLLFDQRAEIRSGLGLLGALVTVTLTFSALTQATSGIVVFLPIITLEPTLFLSLRLDPIGALFAFTIACVHLICKLQAIGLAQMEPQMEPRAEPSRFFASADLVCFGGLALAFSGDLMTLVTAYAFSQLVFFGMILIRDDASSKKAGRLFSLLILIPSQAILYIAWIWTVQIADASLFGETLLLADATPWQFGILTGLFALGLAASGTIPIFFWAPAIRKSREFTPGFIQITAALIGATALLRTVVFVLGPSRLAALDGIVYLSWFCAGAGLLAAISACALRDFRGRVSAAHASGVCLTVSAIFTPSELGPQAAALTALATVLSGATAFICANAVESTIGPHSLAKLAGLAKRMPGIAIALAIACLSLANLPPGGGAAARVGLMRAAGESLNFPLLIAAGASSLLILLGFAPLTARFMFPNPSDEPPTPFLRAKGPPSAVIAAALLAGLLCIGVLMNSRFLGDVIRSGTSFVPANSLDAEPDEPSGNGPGEPGGVP